MRDGNSSAIVLRDYQESAVQRIRSVYASGKRRVVFVLPTAGGKCLGKGTPVLMFDGRVRPVEDIKIGDLLMGPDSAPRRVVSLARGREELFKVKPRKGDPYVVNRSHILSLRMVGGSQKSCGIADGSIVNLSVNEYLARNKTFKHCAKGWRSAVDFPPHVEPFRIDPYFLGLWLGDGSSKGACITTGDQEIKDEVHAYARSIGLCVREEQNSEFSVNLHITTGKRGPGRGYRSNPITLALHQYNLLRNKHIPHRYLTAGRSDRLEILAGILDTDGYWTGKGFDLTLKSESLIDGVIFIARSLGFSAYKSASVKTCCNNGTSGNYWRCNINGNVDQIPCRVKRKQASKRKQIKNPLTVGISVDSIGDGEYFGFQLEGPDRLFLLGDFTVTHNTVIFTYMASAAVAKGSRVLILAHRVELIDQISDTLGKFGVEHGVIAAGRSGNALPVQVGMMGTVVRRLDRLRRPDMIIVDEAHRAVGATYQRILSHWPSAYTLLVTATPARTDGRGLGEVADEMIVGPSVSDLMDAGHLSKYRLFTPPRLVNLSGVKKRGGDWNAEEIQDRMDKPKITGDAVDHYLRIAKGRQFVAFCAGIKHSANVAEAFRAAGIETENLDGTMDKAQRADVVARFRSGKLIGITSCDLLSEGFDLPAVGAAILLRPTQSKIVYLQQVGRSLRVADDKDCAIILDHVGNAERHDLPDAPREWSLDAGIVRKTSTEKKITTRLCQQCFAHYYPHLSSCPHCGASAERKSRALAEVDGELHEVTSQDEWRERVATLSYRAAVQNCKTPEQLRSYAQMKGYKAGWAIRELVGRGYSIADACTALGYDRRAGRFAVARR